VSLNLDQLSYLSEIERLVGLVRSSDVPCPAPEPEPGGVIQVTGDNLRAAISAAPAGSILDLMGKTFPQYIDIDKPLTLVNGGIVAPLPNTNDMVTITGDDVKLRDFTVYGDQATTKNGIVANGKGLDMVRVRVHDIGRPGQETHALVCWNGSHITADDCTFHGGSMAVLFGGNGTAVPNHVPAENHFNNCILGRPIEWKGRFASKTIVEFKNCRNTKFTNCTLENNWQEGPQGHAITITASNYDGRSPLTVTENLTFDNCRILNVNGGVYAIGHGQHHYDMTLDPLEPTLRGNNYQFLNCYWEISKARNGGQGALFTTGYEPLNVLFEGNTHYGDGSAMMRIVDRRLGNGVVFRNNPRLQAGTYGVFGPLGSRGTNYNVQMLDSPMDGNTFVGADSIFKRNFPSNTFVSA